MAIQLPLEVRKWGQDGDEWPDRRVTLGGGQYAVMISPRMASIDVAEKEAQFLADSVNEYADALPLIYDMKEKLQELADKDTKIADLVERAEKALEVTSFDALSD